MSLSPLFVQAVKEALRFCMFRRECENSLTGFCLTCFTAICDEHTDLHTEQCLNCAAVTYHDEAHK